MELIGKVENFKDLEAIYQAVTTGKAGDIIPIEGKPKVGFFVSKKLRFVDHAGVRYVEQNPQSSSVYAQRARQGAKIVWVIRLKGDVYLGRIEDGNVYQKQASSRPQSSSAR